MTEPHFLGLDIETTGSDLTDRIKLIQIGVYDPRSGDLFRSNVGWPDGEFDMVQEATLVHGISRETILQSPRAEVVGVALNEWLYRHGVSEKMGVPIGFNVGSFDMPFVRRDLPRAIARFSYRSVDLNAVLFSMAQSARVPWQPLKDRSIRYARSCGVLEALNSHPHDAGYDAVEAALCWDWCLENIHVGGGSL